MLSPPFTLQKVIILAVLAAVAWVYAIWQVRSQWREYRRRREVIADRGLRPSRRRPNRRTLFTIIFTAALLLLAGYTAYLDQRGTPLARVRLHLIEARVALVMKYLMGLLIVLVLLYIVLHWFNRDPAVVAAAKLSLAGKHADAEAIIRKQIEATGANEQRLIVLGLLLMEQNRLDESLQQLQEAQKLSKRPATAKNNCAFVLWKLGRCDEAARLFDEVCGEEPNNFTAVCNSCLILAELGRETLAFGRLEQAEQLFERYDAKHTKHWVPLLEKCRNAIPMSQGFPVIPSPLEKK